MKNAPFWRTISKRTGDFCYNLAMDDPVLTDSTIINPYTACQSFLGQMTHWGYPSEKSRLHLRVLNGGQGNRVGGKKADGLQYCRWLFDSPA